MATIVEMINPLTGLPEQVDQLDHTAQEIDDAVDLAPQLSNPNLLDNWYFGNPVNQRGQTLYPSVSKMQYTIDRWLSRSWYVETEVMDGYIQLTETTGTQGTTIYFEQIAEQTFIGKKTLSIMLNDGTLYWLSGSSDIVIDFVVDGKSFQFCWLSSGHTVRLSGDAGATIAIKAAKLELGSQQTLAHQNADGNWVLNEIPDYGEQLRRCQRYFWRSWTGERNTQNSILGVVFGNNHRITGFDYPVEMRTRPSITVYGLTGSDKVTEFASDADYGPASPAYWGTQRCVALSCDGAGLSNDNRVYYFIEANAEL